VAQSDDRTLLQKFSDFLPGALASLAPDGGLLSDGPDLAALGYDNVYDITPRVVYMPNGTKLEAHSGFGNLMDDPGHVSERNVGATPPNVYDLKPRERLFHGIAALRMIPVNDNGLFGRSGLLAHSYMMGPNGDSNGCVSIKNYEKFLKAFQNGERSSGLWWWQASPTSCQRRIGLPHRRERQLQIAWVAPFSRTERAPRVPPPLLMEMLHRTNRTRGLCGGRIPSHVIRVWSCASD
jgi:hypothetical protein